MDVSEVQGDVAEDTTATALPIHAAFMQAVALRHQRQANLMDMYQGWMACLLALQVARYTGTFKQEIGFQPMLYKREKLQTIERLAADATNLRSQAAKAKQLAQQVELNLALQRVQAQLTQVRSHL
jgi:endoglucanase Acf2